MKNSKVNSEDNAVFTTGSLNLSKRTLRLVDSNTTLLLLKYPTSTTVRNALHITDISYVKVSNNNTLKIKRLNGEVTKLTCDSRDAIVHWKKLLDSAISSSKSKSQVLEKIPAPEVDEHLLFPPDRINTMVSDFQELYSASDWKPSFTKKDVSVFTKPCRVTGLTAAMGTGVLPYSNSEIVDLLQDIENRKEFDLGLVSSRMVKENSAGNSGIIYCSYEPIRPTAPRDFLNLVHARKISDTETILVAQGTTNDILCPHDRDFVRGDVKIAGWRLQELEDRKTNVSFLVKVDIKGSIPSWILSRAMAQQALMVVNVKKALDKRQKKQQMMVVKQPVAKSMTGTAARTTEEPTIGFVDYCCGSAREAVLVVAWFLFCIGLLYYFFSAVLSSIAFALAMILLVVIITELS